MLKLEQEAVEAYGDLLQECKTKYKAHPALQTNFENLIKDETKHVHLVKKLIQIVEKT